MMDANFERDGYVVLKNIISKKSIESVAAFLQTDIDRSLESARLELGCSSNEEVIAMMDDVLNHKHEKKFSDLSNEARLSISGHFSLASRLSEHLWQIPQEEKFQAAIKSILKTEKLFMHMPPVARFVLPNNVYAGVPAHQDFSYNSHLSNFVTVWIPLVDIDDECGGVIVYEGSGAQAEVPHDRQPDKFWLDGIPTFDYRPFHCKMNAGDVLVFNKNVIHASKLNTSNRTRLSLDCRFFGANDTSTKHYLDLQKGIIISPA